MIGVSVSRNDALATMAMLSESRVACCAITWEVSRERILGITMLDADHFPSPMTADNGLKVSSTFLFRTVLKVVEIVPEVVEVVPKVVEVVPDVVEVVMKVVGGCGEGSGGCRDGCAEGGGGCAEGG